MFRCFKSTKLDEFSLRCSLADLKNDSFREQPSQQIIFFGIFPHFSACCLANSHCDFHFVWKQFFEEKKGKK